MFIGNAVRTRRIIIILFAFIVPLFPAFEVEDMITLFAFSMGINN
jgi:hypothetical protein